MNTIQSWGRYPKVTPKEVYQPHSPSELPQPLSALSILPFGNGRSYGDSCLNGQGTIIHTRYMDRFIDFDEHTGRLRVQAGVLFSDILQVFVPKGWFLPVTPGTKYITVGGAIANDVHGKNHHRSGTFGRYVTQFAILRSSGEELICSPQENTDLFKATIGGLGLTGLITWAEFHLVPIIGPWIDQETIKFDQLEQFIELSQSSDQDYDFSVAWFDCFAPQGKGHFIRGNHSPLTAREKASKNSLQLAIPFNLPNFSLNRLTIGAFNFAYYHRFTEERTRANVHFNPFFYPLDSIHHWNRIYGGAGFLQHQCVVPHRGGIEAIREMLMEIQKSDLGSFLAVLKTFGDLESPGLLSFPRPGITLALDFAIRGQETFALCDKLDEIVRDNSGAVYPAKDARMSYEMFQLSFPKLDAFIPLMDPAFSSNFWRRMEKGRKGKKA